MLSFITIGNSLTTVITKAEIVVIVVTKKKNTKLILLLKMQKMQLTQGFLLTFSWAITLLTIIVDRMVSLYWITRSFDFLVLEEDVPAL